MYVVMPVLRLKMRSRNVQFLAGWNGSSMLFFKPFYKLLCVFLSYDSSVHVLQILVMLIEYK